jgi:hypothetical protein
MKQRNVKEVVEYLLIKKNNFIINEEEKYFLNKLLDLLNLSNNYSKIETVVECDCEFNEVTIDKEIKLNKCLDCGLPLSVS